MSSDHVRRRIAWEAARLIYSRGESEYHEAKRKAARRVCGREPRPADLPSKRQIRSQVEALAQRHEGKRSGAILHEMRVAALRMMRILWAFRPRLVGDVLTGQVRVSEEAETGSEALGNQPGTGESGKAPVPAVSHEIHLHLFSDSVQSVAAVLEAERIPHTMTLPDPAPDEAQRRQGACDNVVLVVHDRFPVRLTMDPSDVAHRALRCPTTGQPVPQATIPELTRLIERESLRERLEERVPEVQGVWDRFQVYRRLLLPLENVQQDREVHPEGDALYHSLQVFSLARDQRPYDEEFLLAALLHDVGKAIDLREHTAAALEALGGHVTPRTAWLIEHHGEAHALRNRSLGARPRRRLEASEDFDELMILADCDAAGRAVGADVPDLDEALEYLRQLAEACGG